MNDFADEQAPGGVICMPWRSNHEDRGWREIYKDTFEETLGTVMLRRIRSCAIRSSVRMEKRPGALP